MKTEQEGKGRIQGLVFMTIFIFRIYKQSYIVKKMRKNKDGSRSTRLVGLPNLEKRKNKVRLGLPWVQVVNGSNGGPTL